jgi:hypothetical protein
MVFFQQIARDASPKEPGRVQSITIRLCVSDCTGSVFFTDLMLQAGAFATGWVGHSSEIRWVLEG